MGKDIKGKTLPRGIVQKANGKYRGRFYYKGDTYSVEGDELKETVIKLENLRYETRHGLKGKGDHVTVEEWFQAWLYNHKKKSIKETTMIKYNNFYRRYIHKEIGKYRLGELKLMTIEKIFQDMADNGYSTKTIRDVYDILNAMYKYAICNRLVTYNPCEGIGLPKTKKKQIRVLTVEEQREILCHAKGRVHENLIYVALGTGMRSGEMLGLTWDDVDFGKREIKVNKTLVYIKDMQTGKYVFKVQTPKTSSGVRMIPMQDSVYKALKRQRIKLKEMQMAAEEWEVQPGFENLVFLSQNGKPISQHGFQLGIDGIERSVNKERKKAAAKEGTEYIPLEHFYPHAFRHTFATRCFEAGIDAKVVQGYLGHASIAITLDLYTHVTDNKAKTEMDKLECLYQKIV